MLLIVIGSVVVCWEV